MPAEKTSKGQIASGAVISFAGDICNDLLAAEQREWLVTNGIGGFASGTVAGSATRRYHGILIAALSPPGERKFLVGGFDELAKVGGKTYDLATHRWVSGAVAPQGYLAIQNFLLDGAIPIWTFLAGSARIEKRVWMQHGENTTFVQYTVLDSVSKVDLELKALVTHRDFHSATHAGDWRMRVEAFQNGACVTAFDGAVPFYLRSARATCELQHVWYRDFFFPRENERGLDDREDQLFAASFHAQLGKGESVTIVCSTEKDASLDGAAALQSELQRQRNVLSAAAKLLQSDSGKMTASWLSQLAFAADQFLVERPVAGGPTGKTIIAGYHWFCDWGRDTMIALPGLTLTTGQADAARQILLAFSRFVDGGMLPNNFPDSGAHPEYNTIDATLWYFEAIREYVTETQDIATLQKLFPILAKIISAHVKGTRYNIHVDPSDGLLYGGGSGVQLTWMDAKIGDWVVTPRTGKPIEINALWINALESMLQFARALNLPGENYQQLSSKAKSSFGRFWNAGRNCCFDVIDAPGIGNDPTLRPNQIFAVSLKVSPLPIDQQKAVVDACASRLLTPFGLRSLAPSERGYKGTYSGNPGARDAVYHQGLVWSWLQGPFALAHYRVYKNRAAALALLEPLAKAIETYGLGTLAEIFEGDAPHHPRGCIAQAWTVGEVLRAWKEIQSAPA